MPANKPERFELLSTTSDIVAAYAGNNALNSKDLPRLIESIFDTVTGLGAPQPEPTPKPAVPLGRSVTKSTLICLECGRESKMLKRHLATAHGLSPHEYRAKWGLAPTYPMVAPEYAVVRSKIAKDIGFGRRATKRERARKRGV